MMSANSALCTLNSALEFEMGYQATHKFARISPRKARLMMNLIRGRDVDDALALLRFAKQRSSGMIEKVVRSAVANANEMPEPPRNTLFVEKAWIDPGPVIKRFQPKDRGKAYPIKKRTAHLVVIVGERAEGEKKHVHKHPVGGRPGKAT
jgi:large subunit ribosomal protein L22